MKSLQGLSYTEIAFEVCTSLDRVGVKAVLSGGGAATVHAPEAYQTQDLDFVLHQELWVPSVEPIVALGFRETSSRGIYSHPDTPYTLEFLKGPLAVGDETLNSWDTLRRRDLVLHVISPIDSVKDRLASAIHYSDFNSIRQAAEITKRHTLDLDAVRAWCEKEGGASTFSVFLHYLEQ